MRNRANLNSTIGDYRLIDFIGAGGMGEVYRGVHTRLGRVVAVKMLTQTHNNQQLVQRFRNEAQLQARLHHPNIATLFDFIEADGRCCIVMEYIDGQTLDEKIRLSGALPLADALRIFKSVVEAIHYIHDNGIVHRDIKSNNIKINAKGEVKILDFGIAKGETSPQLTATGSVIGTLQYLSPEQVKGEVADERSDIWALGSVFYEMVSGKVTFDATTLGRLCESILKSEYVPPTVINPELPKAVEQVIARCLKKNPAARYQTTQELFEDVKRLSVTEDLQEKPNSGEKIAVEPFSIGVVLEQFGQRKFGWVAVASLLVVVLLGLGIAFWPEDHSPKVAEPSRQNPSQPPSTKDATLRTVKIIAANGQAEVYSNGQLVGKTPYEIKARLGEPVNLLLKSEGFLNEKVEFAVTEKPEYVITLKKE
ncbi:MAG: serine/threonine-protein kinase [Acidobacteriota bacterium]